MKTATARSLATPAGLFKACADPVRLRLLNLLAAGEVCVCHLHEALELPQPTVSRHLAYLRRAGLVSGRKDGLWVHYRLSQPIGRFHQSLIECLATLQGVETMQKDRKRLSRLSCC
jgi:ArsR family transcriptional regulator